MRSEKLLELKNLIENLKTVDLKKSTEKPNFLKVETYNCTLNNGKTIKREKLIKGENDGSAAVILPLTRENNVVLTVEPRVFTKKTVGIGIPAGYIEKNESGKEAALRELKEEIGYVPSKIISLGGFYQDEGCSSAYNQLFLGLDCEKKYNQNLDPGEFVKYFECSFEEALELIDMNYIEGGNTLTTFARAKKYVRIEKIRR